MKIKKTGRKSVYLYATILLIVIISAVLTQYALYVQKTTTQQCFSILDDSRMQIGQMITNEMQTEQEHLESASYLLTDLLEDYERNQELIINIMAAWH